MRLLITSSLPKKETKQLLLAAPKEIISVSLSVKVGKCNYFCRYSAIKIELCGSGNSPG